MEVYYLDEWIIITLHVLVSYIQQYFNTSITVLTNQVWKLLIALCKVPNTGALMVPCLTCRISCSPTPILEQKNNQFWVSRQKKSAWVPHPCWVRLSGLVGIWAKWSISVCASPNINRGGISSSILSVFFTDKFALSQSDARISVAYNSCQWKTLTKCLMKFPSGPICFGGGGGGWKSSYSNPSLKVWWL